MSYTQDWGAIANISSTMGVNEGRLCLGESSRGDLGCPAYAPYVSSTSGSVGIGTSVPSSTLHVNSASGLTLSSTGGMTSRFYTGGSNLNLTMDSNGYFHIRDFNTSPIVTLRGTGNVTTTGMMVGINSAGAPPSTTLHIKGAIRLSNQSDTCDDNRLGAIKYESSEFQVCRNTVSGWEPLVTGGISSTVDRITSNSQAGVFANSTGYISLTTGGVTGTVYFNPAGILVNRGVSTTGPISATNGYFNGNISATGAISANNRLTLESLATGANFITYRANGTAGNLSALADGNYMNVISAYGYGATGYSTGGRASIAFATNQAWTDTAQGTQLMFFITPNNSISQTDSMRLSGNGLTIGRGSNGPRTRLDVSGSIRIAAETTGSTLESCDTNRLGAIKYESNEFQVCRTVSNGWEPLVTGGISSTVDRIISSSQAAVFANDTGYISLTTGGVTGTVYFNPAGILVNRGVSTTGPISGTDGYFNGAVTATGTGTFNSLRIQNGNSLNWVFTNSRITGSAQEYLAFSTSNTEALRIVSSGYVGIGTTAPASIFTVGTPEETSLTMSANTASATISIFGQDRAYFLGRNRASNNEFVFGSSQSGDVFAGSMSNDDFELRTGNVRRLVIKQTGLIGIGTNSPSSTLHVSGTTRTNTLQLADSPPDTCTANTIGTIKFANGRPYICVNR